MKKVISILLICTLAVLTLASCSSSFSLSADELMNKVEAKGYYSSNLTTENAYRELESFCDLFYMDVYSVSTVIAVSPSESISGTEMGYFIYCNTSEDAYEWYTEAKELSKEDEDFREYIKNPTVKKSGNVVYVGSENTWNKFK